MEDLDELFHHLISMTPGTFEEGRHLGLPALVICHTTLVATFRQMFPGTFTFDKNRSILFRADQEIPRDELRECISMALTYHL